MKTFALAVAMLGLALPQTRVHAPTQVRDGITAGSAIGWHYGTLAFGPLGAGQCAELSFAAPGASAGMTVAPGWPSELPPQTHGLMYAGSGLIVVRLCAAQSVSVPPLTFSAAAITWR